MIMYKVVFSVLHFAHTAKYHSLIYPLCIKLYFQYVLHFAHAAKYDSHTHFMYKVVVPLCVTFLELDC